MTLAHIALGANLGDREATLHAALRDLTGLGEIRAVSSIYETDPVGFDDQPAYLNAVAALSTELPPEALLRALLQIEASHGRVRTFSNAPRTLDLDLLLYGDRIIQTEELVVPHPRMHERSFVLVPLLEIAPQVKLPGLDSSGRELLDRIGGATGITLFAPPPSTPMENANPR